MLTKPVDLDTLSFAEIDRLPFGVVQVDAGGTILFSSEGESRLSGQQPDEVVGRNFFRDVAPCTRLPAFYGRFIEGVRRGGLDQRFQFVFGFDPAPARVAVHLQASREPGRYWIQMELLERLPPSRHREAMLAVGRRSRAEPVDPSACEREPIHIPGSIQPQAVVLAADPDTLEILACSENVADAFEREPSLVLGRRLDEVLPPEFVSEVREARDAGALTGARPLARAVRIGTPERPYAVAVHAHGGKIVLELELAPARAEDFGAASTTETRAAVTRLRAAATLAEAADAAAREVRALTRFERVLIYRFDVDWNGEAIAEARDESWDESLLGLFFPASDIPAQARELYAKTSSRFVADRDYVPVPLVAAPQAGNAPLDLSFAQFRALSPVHLEYQRNLGVNGSMSASIMVEGRLWGLVIGHHRQPHYVAPETRAAAAIIADAFGMRVHELETRELWIRQQEHLAVRTALLQQMAGADDFVRALTQGSSTLGDLFEASGAAVVSGDAVVGVGRLPQDDEVRSLADWMRREKGAEGLLVTDHLASVFPPAAAFKDAASGVLAVFVDAARHHLVLWVKPEVPSTVTWGGDPRKPVLAEAGTGMVLPRRSFDRWVEQRTGYSTPWPAWQVAIAETLVGAIEGVILRQQREIGALRAKQEELTVALARKDLLSREIDHRVKNSLQIVASFLRMQGRTIQDPAARQAFGDTYGRVMSVARVHDSLYHSEDVEHVDLGQTIENLCNDLTGMAGEQRGLEIKAEPGVIVPYRTGVALSLIASELVTNAFKYAYAPGDEGGVEVAIRRDEAGVRLTVCDQGKGLPEDWAERPSQGLGMKLIRAMLDQIGARLEVDNTHGACFSIRI